MRATAVRPCIGLFQRGQCVRQRTAKQEARRAIRPWNGRTIAVFDCLRGDTRHAQFRADLQQQRRIVSGMPDGLPQRLQRFIRLPGAQMQGCQDLPPGRVAWPSLKQLPDRCACPFAVRVGQGLFGSRLHGGHVGSVAATRRPVQAVDGEAEADMVHVATCARSGTDGGGPVAGCWGSGRVRI